MRAVGMALVVAGASFGWGGLPAEGSPIPPMPELWTIAPDGSDPVPLSEEGFGDGFDWSPDGTQLAFSFHGDIWVSRNGTEEPVNITNSSGSSERDPAWSPDGTEIAFSGIGMVNADGTGRRMLQAPDGSQINGSGPDWSPDGQTLSFVTGRAGRAADVFTVSTDGSDLTRVIEAGALFTPTAWSPDGARIAFRTWEGGLRAVAPDGGQVLDLAAGGVSSFDWSPSGRRMLVGGTDGAFAVDVPSVTRTRVAEGRVSGVSWSPDASRIAFSAGDLFVAQADGSDPVRITDTALRDEFELDWSPAGTRIAFAALREQVLCDDPHGAFSIEANVVGTEGDDVLRGTDGPDVIAALGGNDVAYGLAGRDLVCGGDGDDTIYGGAGPDTVTGEAGHDLVLGGRGNDRLFGAEGADRLRGGDGHDILRSGAGTDALQGGAGNDALRGGRGSDLLRGGPDDDGLNGDGKNKLPGADAALGGRGHDHCRFGELYRGCELSSAERNDMRRPPGTLLRSGESRQKGAITFSYCWTRSNGGSTFIAFCAELIREEPRAVEPGRSGASAFIRFHTSERPDTLKLLMKRAVDDFGHPTGRGEEVSFRWRKKRASDGSLAAWDAVFRLPDRTGDVYPVGRARWAAHGTITYDWHLRLRN